MEQTQHLTLSAHSGRIISPLLARGWLDWAAGPEQLAADAREADLAAARLVCAGNPSGMVTRFLASIHDGLYVGLGETPRRRWPSGWPRPWNAAVSPAAPAT